MNAKLYILEDHRKASVVEEAFAKTRNELIDEFLLSLREQEKVEQDLRRHYARVKRDLDEFGDIA